MRLSNPAYSIFMNHALYTIHACALVCQITYHDTETPTFLCLYSWGECKELQAYGEWEPTKVRDVDLG